MVLVLEQLFILVFTLFFPPLLCLCLLVTVLAIFGKSLGIRRAYVHVLLRIFSWARRTIKIAKRSELGAAADPALLAAAAVQDRSEAHSDDDSGVSSEETVSEHSDSSDEPDDVDDSQPIPANQLQRRLSVPKKAKAEKKRRYRNRSRGGLIKREATERLLTRKKLSLAEPVDSKVMTVVNDSLDFIKAGMETIIEDEVTNRFTAEELASWNLLTRTSRNYQFVNWKFAVVWCCGFLFRYGLLFPGRLILFLVGILWMLVSTAFVGLCPAGSTKKWLNAQVMLVSHRILSRSVSAIVTYHNLENRARPGGICVANHTSPFDVVLLSCDNCYAMVGQRQGGLLGVIQRALSRASDHIWFERAEANDRAAVARRLRDHVEMQKMPILIFPEGTCINNTSVMMFKKGSFEVGGTIYPAAIKYDPRFGDPFWNSSEQGWLQYNIMMMTSWAIVADIWYLPPVTRQEGESGMDFASRVKATIAEAGGLVDLEWDGQLKRYPVKRELIELQQKSYSRRVQRAHLFPEHSDSDLSPDAPS